VALDVYGAKFQITAGVTGTDAIDKFNVKLNTVGKTADAVNRNMASLSSGVKMLAGAFGVQQIANLALEFARATIQIDAFQKQLSVGFGKGGSKAELITLRDTMVSLGISQEEALGSAVRFTSALKLSGQSMSEANRNFEAASKLILSNKLSAEGAQRVYYAMAQIASKGKLMSEELNGQLGDTLAGFTQQVAVAMGKSTAELLKSMQDGKVSAEQFFTALQKIGDGIDPNSLDSAARSLANLKNAWFEFKTSAVEAGTIKSGLDAMTGAVQFLTANYQTLNALMIGGLLVTFGRYGSSLIASTEAKLANAAASRAEAVAEMQAAEAQMAEAVVVQRFTAYKIAQAEAIVGVAAAEQAAALVTAEATSVMAAAEARLATAREAMIATGAATGLMGRGFSGLISMLGGPWGIALAAAAGAVYFLSTRLDENEQAIKAAQSAGDSYARSQSFFSRMIDTSTGKIAKMADETWKAYAAQMALNTAQARTKANETREAAAAAVRNDPRNQIVTSEGRQLPEGGYQMELTEANPQAKAASDAIKRGDLKALRALLPGRGKKGGIHMSAETYAALGLAENEASTSEAAQRWIANAAAGKPQSDQDKALLQGTGFLAADTPAKRTTAPTGGGSKTKAQSPYESAMDTLGGNTAQAKAELAAMDQYGAKVKNANEALAIFETTKGKYAKWSDAQKAAYIGEATALDALEQKISGLSAANSSLMDMGKQKAQGQFELDHWEQFGTNLNRAREAQVEFNIEQGVYKGAADEVIAKLRAEAIATDNVTKAIKDKQKADAEEKDTLKAFAKMRQENDALRDQALALSMTNFEYEQMVAHKKAVADIDEHVIGWEQDKAEAYRKGAEAILAQREALERLNYERDRSFLGGTQKALHDYADQIGNLGQDAMNLWTDALKGTEDALVQFCQTGKLSFKDMANSIIADLIRIAIRQALVGAITKGLGAIFGGGTIGAPMALNAGQQALTGAGAFGGPMAANGMAFDYGGVRKYAAGGVVSSPTFFRYGGGIGQMGEAGPEAIVPLKRMNNGRLGVEMHGGKGGGGDQNVTVNVNVEGGTQQSNGDPGKAAELGKAIASAVRAELVQQKRPGGLLAA
jgi:lambda family phage tail tape measure protein